MAFTAITGGVDWQALSFLNELAGAWRERYQAMGLSASYIPDLFEIGDDVQTIGGAYTPSTSAKPETCFRHMQKWLDWACVVSQSNTGWINHNITVAGSAIATLFTLSTFRSVAGLSSSGWRRATTWSPDTDDWTNLSDAMWSRAGNGFGEMQAGDIVGPWIFDDLQKAFDALRWRLEYRSVGGQTNWQCYADVAHRTGQGFDSDCATSRAEASSNWTSHGWVNGVGDDGPLWRFSHDTGSDIIFKAERWRGKPQVTGVNLVTGRTFSWEVYIKCRGDDALYSSDYNDFDGNGLVKDQLTLWDQGAGASAATVTADILGDIDTFPLDVAPSIGCPIAEVDEGRFAGDCYWVIKWNFTHAL